MLKLKKIIKLIIIIIFIILLAGVGAGGYFGYKFINANKDKISSLESRLDQSLKQNEALKGEVEKLASDYAGLEEKTTEVMRREVIKQKSQEELLTEAVAKAAPAVVSIVVTKDVPQLEVVYINPFGDDPFFKDFGVRIPQYRQKGTAEEKVGAGTGFIVNTNGYIVTNRHVADDKDARYTVLLTNGNQQRAEVVYRDDQIDVAILKIEGSKYSAISLGNSDDLKLGQSVFAVGNALGEYSNSVSVGIISGLNRDIEAFGGNKTEKLQGVIQTDAAINPGNSGGPLVDLSGKVVGVNVAMASAENIGFAIPINIIKPIISAHVK